MCMRACVGGPIVASCPQSMNPFLDDFHVAEGDPQWVTLIDQKIKPVFVLMLLSRPPWLFSLWTIWERTFSPTHVWTHVIPRCAHRFVILTADAVHLNISIHHPLTPRVLQHFFCSNLFSRSALGCRTLHKSVCTGAHSKQADASPFCRRWVIKGRVRGAS